MLRRILPNRVYQIARNIYRSSIYLIHFGFKFRCPICLGHFRRFLNDPAECCPKCLSKKRQRKLWLYLQNKTTLFFQKQIVLHFAPEEYISYKLRKLENLEYTTADLDPNVADVVMDITDIPKSNDCIDFIICNHVLEHVQDDKKAMTELYRVLKPGGCAILQVPMDSQREETFEDPSIISPEERKCAFGQCDHVRVYGLDYLVRLKNSGFNVKVEFPTMIFDKNTIEKYCLDTGPIYFVQKPI